MLSTPYYWNFMPSKSDLDHPSLDDFVDVNEYVSESVVEKPIVETNEPETTRKENVVEKPKVKTVEMFNKPSFAKIKFVKSTEQEKSPRKTSVDKNRQNTPSPRGNKRKLDNRWSQKFRDGNPQQDLKNKDVIDSGFALDIQEHI
ncbi:hypothetical protein Tco_0540647 [Tanacetum coccineum]